MRNLYDAIRYSNYDVVRAGFIKESKHGVDRVLSASMESITWFHGKVYRVAYLRENNIRFPVGLYTEEDAFFNLVAWNCTENRGELNEILYIWRDYKNSLTRKMSDVDFFKRSYLNYIKSQILAMKKIYDITHSVK